MKLSQIPGLICAGVILTFVTAALSALFSQSSDVQLTTVISQLWHSPYYRHITFFSFYQALLSTLLSVGLAIPIAHALSRRHFCGKEILLKIFATTLVLPVLVAVFGLLAIYGNSGLLAQWLEIYQLKLPYSIYGLNGILLAHVFFNLPFATRLFLQSLNAIPSEQHKLCGHLGLNQWTKFKLIEWPRLLQQLPHVAGLVFMLCFTSFASVMALGGGPKSTTIELAIYQAIKFDFELQTGALLALWQMLICGTLAGLLQKKSPKTSVSANYGQTTNGYFIDSRLAKCWDSCWIILVVLLVLPPLITVVVAGLNAHLAQVLSDQNFWLAVKSSMIVATSSALIAVVAGIFILWCSRAWRLAGLNFYADKIELIAMIILVTPGLVISTGLFLLLRDITNVFDYAIYIVIMVNALMALPFVIKGLAQPMLQCAQKYDQLCASLGIFGWSRLTLVEWKLLKQPIGHVLAISFVLSIGDLSAVALFGSQDFKTLPLYLFQLLGSYQMDAAAVVALFLLIISVGIFSVTEKLLQLSPRNKASKT